MELKEFPIPPHFDPLKLKEIYRVDYGGLFPLAKQWASDHGISPFTTDGKKIAVLVIDAQNTFCIPDHELFVGGQSGTGAVDDNRRLCEFVYRNLGSITEIHATMDTHRSFQIFHSPFWVDKNGENPAPMTTMISVDDVKNGVWEPNPLMAPALGWNYTHLKSQVLHYVKELEKKGKYILIIWPFHAMLGGIGHALVSAVEEAMFFHCIARGSFTGFEIKGGNPLTENYSVLEPEVTTSYSGDSIAQSNTRFIQKLMNFDAVIIAGQAKSHCVAWTIDDLLEKINVQDPDLAKKVYLLEDCTSPVVVPGVIDFTEQANEAFKRFADAGMNVVQSTDPMKDWAGI